MCVADAFPSGHVLRQTVAVALASPSLMYVFLEKKLKERMRPTIGAQRKACATRGASSDSSPSVSFILFSVFHQFCILKFTFEIAVVQTGQISMF